MKRFLGSAVAALLVAGVVWGAGLRVSPLVTSPSGTTIIIGGDGGTTYTGTAPIDVTGSVISCVSASGVVGGCLTTGSQDIGGVKTFKAAQVFEGYIAAQGSQAIYPGVNGSVLMDHGIGVGVDGIASSLDNNAITIRGTKNNADPGADVIFQGRYFRDAGSYFSILTGGSCASQILGVAPSGDVVVTAAPAPDCNQVSDILNQGALVDGTAASGHIFIRSYPKLYLGVRGDLAANHDAVLADGGRPVADGGYWIRTESDGGTYFPYSGLHGGLSVNTPEAQWGGWLFELRNAGATGQPSRFYVDSWGGIGQNHQLALSNFPACPGFGLVTSLGQFSYGAATGVLMSDINSGRWYQCTASGWSMMAQQAPVYLPPVLVNAALTVSTLGGFVLPSGYDPTVSALTFYVGASGTGGSTNATIRLSDGTLQCDFAFACNTSTGAKRIAGSGAGCGSFTAGSTFTLSVVSIGDCAVGPTLTGNATVEALWR